MAKKTKDKNRENVVLTDRAKDVLLARQEKTKLSKRYILSQILERALK